MRASIAYEVWYTKDGRDRCRSRKATLKEAQAAAFPKNRSTQRWLAEQGADENVRIVKAVTTRTVID